MPNPQTPLYGFPYEDSADEPGETLDGGSAGTRPILARVLETKIASMDAAKATQDTAIATADARLDDLEAGTTMVGWVPIQNGGPTGAVPSFDIDLTDGGRFAIGEFELVRLQIRYDLDVAGGYVNARINNDSSPVYLTGSLVYNAAGTLADSDHSATRGSWRIGYGSTISTGNLIATFFDMGANVLHSYQSTSNRQSTTLGSHRHGIHWGSLTAALGAAPSSIRILADGTIATTVNALLWVAEGYRAP